MCLNSLQKSINQTLRIINISISKIPNSKKPMISNRISRVMDKYNQSQIEKDNQKLQAFYNQLKFNLNFIKLSFPELQNDIKKEEQIQKIKKQLNEQQTRQKQNQKQGQNIQQKQNYDDIQLSQSTKIFLRQSLEQSAKSNIRQQVEFTNWWQGNADPENMKTHKQLLKRQHFAGDYWKDRQMPVSYTKQFLEKVKETGKVPEIQQEFLKNKKNNKGSPQKVSDAELRFEKVKR